MRRSFVLFMAILIPSLLSEPAEAQYTGAGTITGTLEDFSGIYSISYAGPMQVDFAELQYTPPGAPAGTIATDYALQLNTLDLANWFELAPPPAPSGQASVHMNTTGTDGYAQPLAGVGGPGALYAPLTVSLNGVAGMGGHVFVLSQITTTPQGLVLSGSVSHDVFSTNLSFTFRPTVLYVDADATGSASGHTWVDAFTNLQDAIAEALPGDEIWVAEGVYVPTTGLERTASFPMQSGVAWYGGFAGIETDRAQRNWEAHETLLSGDIGTPDPGSLFSATDNVYHVVDASGTDTSAVLDGFVVSFGHAQSPSPYGGGIYAADGSPTIRNCRIESNACDDYSAASGGGGGVYLSNSTATFENVTIASNAVVKFGGGVRSDGGSPTFSNVRFHDNAAASFGAGAGGGMLGTGTFTDVEFVNNWVDEGAVGGGLNGGGTLTRVLFENNASRNGAGGMYGWGTLTDVDFIGNNGNYAEPYYAPWYVGGGGMSGGGTLTNVRFIGNLAQYGSGLRTFGDTQLTNVEFIGNAGEAVFNGTLPTSGASTRLDEAARATTGLVMTNVTLYRNGQGLINRSSTYSVQNSIFWVNDQNGQPSIVNEGAAGSVANSLIQGSGGSGLGWTVDFGIDLGGNLDTDPMFVDPNADDVRLRFASPAIDLGNDAFVPVEVSLDLDGNPRIRGLHVDAGAYEFHAFGLLSIADIPNDQGRQVRLTWDRIGDDAQGVGVSIIGYDVFRRIDPLTPARKAAVAATHAGNWDYSGRVPSSGAETYNYVVPTLCDSTVAGVCWSAFFVRAVTDDPYVFYDCAVDSGYSIDNLAPAIPAGLDLQRTLLTWGAPEDPDFKYFTIYGSDSAVLDASAHVVAHTTTESHDVGSDDSPFFHVTATDFAGNESEAASTQGWTATPDVSPLRTTLHQNVPNPFNPSTTIQFDLASRAEVTLTIYDLSGRMVRTLISGEPLDPDRHRRTWDGTDANGRRVASGVYLYRVEAGAFAQTRRMVLLK